MSLFLTGENSPDNYPNSGDCRVSSGNPMFLTNREVLAFYIDTYLKIFFGIL